MTINETYEALKYGPNTKKRLKDIIDYYYRLNDDGVYVSDWETEKLTFDDEVLYIETHFLKTSIFYKNGDSIIAISIKDEEYIDEFVNVRWATPGTFEIVCNDMDENNVIEWYHEVTEDFNRVCRWLEYEDENED